MGWGKVAAVISVQLVVILLLVPSSWMERVIEIENRWLTQQMGADSAAWISGHARSIYDTTVVQSGLMDGTYHLLLPSRAQKAQSGAMSELGGRTIFPYVHDRLETTFLVIYQSILRVMLVCAWLPFAALLLLPAIVDGIVAWRIRKTTFNFASPTINHYALLGAGVVTTVMLVAVLAPIPAPPLALPVAVLALCPALYFAVSHTSKRI